MPEVAWAGGLSGLGGGGVHGSTQHNSTWGQAEQRHVVHGLLLSGTELLLAVPDSNVLGSSSC